MAGKGMGDAKSIPINIIIIIIATADAVDGAAAFTAAMAAAEADTTAAAAAERPSTALHTTHALATTALVTILTTILTMARDAAATCSLTFGFGNSR